MRTSEQIDRCDSCGLITDPRQHAATCFPTFQRALLKERPELMRHITMEIAEAIEAVFRTWTPIVLAAERPGARDLAVANRLADAVAIADRACRRPAHATVTPHTSSGPHALHP